MAPRLHIKSTNISHDIVNFISLVDLSSFHSQPSTLNMESLRGRRGSTQGAPQQSQSSVELIYEELRPSYDWTRDTNARTLLVDLPGFKKEELKVQVDSLGKLTISGERKVSERKYSRFMQVFNVPADSDIKRITGKFENGILFIIMPIKEAEKKEEPQKLAANDTAKKEEKPSTQKQEPKKEEREKKPTAQKQEPKKEEAGTGKDSTKKEEQPAPKKEDAAAGKDETKKEEKPTPKEKEKPAREDSGIGKDVTKMEEKPIKTIPAEEPRKEEGATAKDGTMEEEKPKQRPKEKAKKEDRMAVIDGFSKKDEEPFIKKGPKKEDAEGDKQKQKQKHERGFVGTISKKEEKGGGDGKQGWRRESFRRKENLGEKRDQEMAPEEEEELGLEENLFERLMDQVSRNKAVIAAAAVAISLGIYLARKLR